MNTMDRPLPDSTSCVAFERAFLLYNVGAASSLAFGGFLVNTSSFDNRLSPTVGCTLVRVIRGRLIVLKSSLLNPSDWVCNAA